MTLLMPHEVDLLFRYRPGRAKRLARQGKIPHITLPDGEIRFVKGEIERIVGFDLPAPRATAEEREVAHA